MSGGIHVAVAASTVSFGVALLFEVDSVFLGVSGPEGAVAAQVALLAQDGRGLGISGVVLTRDGAQGAHQGYGLGGYL